MKRMNKQLLFVVIIVMVLSGGCVTIKVGLEPLPPETPKVFPTQSPTQPAQNLGPDYNSGVAVTGWLGEVYSLATGNIYEDVLNLEPQGTGIIGIAGAGADIDRQIKSLRDTGKQANFWGILTCGVDDFNGCQLVIERLRREGPGPFFEMDRVEGWYGTLIGSIPGTEYDNAFILAGDFPIQYGVGSSISLIEEAIKSLENTNTGVRIWGQVICGVPDAGNCHIYITDLNIISNKNPTHPTETPSIIRSNVVPDRSWVTYKKEALGLEFKYPPDAKVTNWEANYLPPMKIPQSASDEEILDLINRRFGNTLCVEIAYRTGFIFISPPPNRGDKYVQCSRRGMSLGDIVNKSESTMVGSSYQIFKGIEFVGDGFTLDQHNETFSALLDNGYTIQYGAVPILNISFASYLLTTKQTLLAILASMVFNTP
jgi:hypothetical protein